MSNAAEEAPLDTSVEQPLQPTESEVNELIRSIKDASSPPPAEDLDLFSNASYYWDASTMAPLSAASVAAIARLRAYKPPPFPVWDKLPASRRAAVLLLLYADRRGDLRVVITMRAASLRSFSGHAAFPGGKADSIEETPYQIARREAWEEIGLPMDDSKIPSPFRIEYLCSLPCSLARTELIVRPCVAFLHSSIPAATTSSDTRTPTVEEALMPKLDAKEVAAVFSAPFHNFLKKTDEVLPPEREADLPPGPWYEGQWMHWHEEPWRLHHFYVPVTGQRVTKPKKILPREAGEEQQHLGAVAERLEEEEEQVGRYKVWGMTGRILVDAARVAYAEEPEFEHNSHFGDEKLIDGLYRLGKLGEKKKVAPQLTREDMDAAKEASKM